MRAAVQASLDRRRSGRGSWIAAIDADIAAVMSKIQQLANDPGGPDQRAPNLRELMNAMQNLRTTTSLLAAIADDAEKQQLARITG